MVERRTARRARLALAIAVTAAVLPLTRADAAPAVGRVAGSDRYDTAAKLSAQLYAPGVPMAMVATGDNFPDALAAGPAARAVGGPVLLVGHDALPPSTAAELDRLKPQSILLLGGTNAVTAAVETQLASHTSGAVQRLAGGDRYETAAKLAQSYQPGVNVVYVVNGDRFPDALSAAAAAGRAHGPLLLVQADSIPPATQAQLHRLAPQKIVIAGGVAAVSSGVETQLGAFGPTSREFGADRYATAVAVSSATQLANGPDTVYLATGENFPDALTAGAPAGRDGAPILLSRPNCLPAPVAAELNRLDPTNVVVLGGEGALSGAVAALVTCATQTTPGMLQNGTTIVMDPIQSYGFGGHLGADLLDANGQKICPPSPPGCGYWGLRNFSTIGVVDGGGMPIQTTGVAMARIEIYPDLVAGNPGTNDPWNDALTVGGLHLWDPDGRALTSLRLPHASNGAIRYFGTVTSGGTVPADNRLEVDAFQLVEKDATPGAFNISKNHGGQWTAGWVWPGTYEMFFRDATTGATAHVRLDLRAGQPINVDLSKPCFGLASTCA